MHKITAFALSLAIVTPAAAQPYWGNQPAPYYPPPAPYYAPQPRLYDTPQGRRPLSPGESVIEPDTGKFLLTIAAIIALGALIGGATADTPPSDIKPALRKPHDYLPDLTIHGPPDTSYKR